VNPDSVATPGVPQYVALMGRFMEQHFQRCSAKIDTTFWNEFRLSLVDYLILSVPEFSRVETYSSEFPWFRMLKSIEAQTGEAPTRFALELLNRFDCDWSAKNLEQHAVAIAKDRGLVAPEIVQRAFREVRGKRSATG
jgi:hypothetical protein